MSNVTDYIELQKNEISQKNVEITKAIIENINLYLSSFNNAATFSFSRSDTKKDEEAYMKFLLGISQKISALSDLNAKLASLLIEADKAMMIEATLLLQKRFDAFCVFENALYDYTSTLAEAFSNNRASPSFIVSATQKFKFSVEYLLKENS